MIDPSDQDANESDFEYVKDSDLPSDEIGEKESQPQQTITLIKDTDSSHQQVKQLQNEDEYDDEDQYENERSESHEIVQGQTIQDNDDDEYTE